MKGHTMVVGMVWFYEVSKGGTKNKILNLPYMGDQPPPAAVRRVGRMQGIEW
jgi:hypothetical protein